jgi:chromosome segregation ATPase
MRRALVFLLLVVLFGFTFGVTVDSRAATRQSNSTSNSAANDSQTLQALLREVRELRQDLRTTTVASERAQILLTRLQAQQQAVTAAQKEVDGVRNQQNQAENRHTNIERQIQYYSDQDTEDATPDPARRQSLEQEIKRMKEALQEAETQRDSLQANEMRAKDELQVEQSKLAALQSELDEIDRALANLASTPVN